MSTTHVESELRIVTLRVRKWREAVKYYTQCVGLQQRFADEASQYAMFEAGPVRFAVEGPLKPAYPRGDWSGALMANFQVGDIARTRRELAASGAHVLTEVLQGPGYSYIAIADPEGNEHIVYQRTA